MTSTASIPPLSQIEVIAPNFKKRHSGVTSTVIRLVPVLARDIAIVASGPELPPEVPNLPPNRLLGLPRHGPNGARVWHARRNVEMVGGLILKHLARKDFKMLFTSAAQRRHTGFTRWLIGQMDAVIATSGKSAAYLDRSATVIHHGVNCGVFQPEHDRAALRRKLNLPSDGIFVGCFGRIRHQKGNDIFVEAMIRLCAEVPEVRGLIMGRATDDNQQFLADLKDKTADAGLEDRILFRDEVPIEQLAAHFQAMDIYVAPQRWEGFGLTPLEAMACGVPVIATKVGAFEELIVEGETGHLVEIEDTDTIVSHLTTLAKDTPARTRYSSAARAHVVDNFSIEAEAAAILRIYRDLLKSA